MPVVTISARPASLQDLLRIATGATVELADDAEAAIAASRAVVDRLLEGDEPVYGLTTGVGHLKDVRLPDDELRSTQVLLLTSHAGGLGEPAPGELVRAAMAARLIGVARGGSGASPALADVLVAMLNAGVHPIVPARGSVGMGDLGQLASIGRVALGGGEAEFAGEPMSGAEALARGGIEPLRLEPKDGLTFMSHNGFAIAAAAFAVDRARGLVELADVVAALSMEAVGAGTSVVHPAVADAKPSPGSRASAEAVRAALAGGAMAGGEGATSVQPPLSFRVIPQVHGAARGAVDAADAAALVELNARADNPLVSIDEDAMIHNGNFDAVALAIAFDQLRIALAHLGHLAERRMSHLWDAFFAVGPPPTPSEDDPGPPPAFHGLSLRYPAAASWAELRRLAQPATLDVPTLDLGIEDVASDAPGSIRATDVALDRVEEILSVEVLLAGDVLTTGAPRALGRGTITVLDAVRRAVSALGDGPSPAAAQRAAAGAIRPASPSASVSS